MNTLMLIDGNSLMNRAYYGVGRNIRLTSPEGVPTGAIMAFLNMLLQYDRQFNPSHLLVAFDRPEPTFRHVKYAEYKGTRSPMPDDLVVQMHLIKEILDDWGVARIEQAGYEADDLIGTFAEMGEDAGMDVLIMSGDKDSFQLISDKTNVIMPVTAGGKSTQERYDRDRFFERYGIMPEQFVDVKALMGDSSDNIPGVRGIGEKTALSLITEFGSLQDVYDSLDKIKGAKHTKLSEGKSQAMASKELVEIDRAIPADKLSVKSVDETVKAAPGDKLRHRLLSLGLRQLLQRFDLTGTEETVDMVPAKTFSSLERFLDACDVKQPLAVLVDGDKTGQTFLLGQVDVGYVRIKRSDLLALIEKKHDYRWLVWDYKRLLHAITPHEFNRLPFDAFIAQALIEPSSSQSPVLAQTYGRYYDSPLAEDEDKAIQAVTEVMGLAALHPPLETRLQKDGLNTVFYDIEMPLVPVLARMESRGIRVDADRLKKQAEVMERDITSLEQDIFEEAGHSFNLNSPKQLSEVLFVEMKLPPGKKNQSGQYSTAQGELDRLEADYPIIAKIKEHRLLSKLKQTFLQGLLREIGPDGRIHTTYTQVETATGRLSSVKPNLQNIPIRSERGRRIRDVFVAKPGHVLLDADYSQVELRIVAHLADDAKLKAAFGAHKDVHAVTASELFLIPPEAVAPDQRAIAKTVNFSIVYGVGDFGLSKSLNSSVAEARDYIEAYNRLYKNVRLYLDGQIAKAYEQGYVTTLHGRRRYMHELKSSNRNVRNFGERAAMNAPVQGMAADLIKLAMVRVENGLKEHGLDAKLLLQVHDELIVEVSKKDADAAAVVLQAAMEGAMTLSVALEAEVSAGPSWGQAKS